MPPLFDQEVRTRAANCCEYCLIPESADITPHQIDHIISRKHRGPDAVENLALACLQCNTCKGPNIAGIDPDTREITRLFNPRTDRWVDHFSLDLSGVIIARTAIGRTTLYVLRMNESGAVTLRACLIEEGVLTPG
jgi:hypothetical protein